MRCGGQGINLGEWEWEWYIEGDEVLPGMDGWMGGHGVDCCVTFRSVSSLHGGACFCLSSLNVLEKKIRMLCLVEALAFGVVWVGLGGLRSGSSCNGYRGD